jgi:hypothetical protein
MTAQFRGHTDAGEFLVTVWPAEGTKPACAEVAWRRDEWETFDAPVQCAAVPVTAVSAK